MIKNTFSNPFFQLSRPLMLKVAYAKDTATKLTFSTAANNYKGSFVEVAKLFCKKNHVSLLKNSKPGIIGGCLTPHPGNLAGLYYFRWFFKYNTRILFSIFFPDTSRASSVDKKIFSLRESFKNSLRNTFNQTLSCDGLEVTGGYSGNFFKNLGMGARFNRLFSLPFLKNSTTISSSNSLSYFYRIANTASLRKSRIETLQVFNARTTTNLCRPNTHRNFRVVLAILNFIFLFIVFTQKLAIFLNSYFLHIACRVLDSFRVYMKANAIFEQVNAIFGSDFGMKYFLSILWSTYLNPKLASKVERFNILTPNYTKDLLIPFSLFHEEGVITDLKELKARNAYILDLNERSGNFVRQNPNPTSQFSDTTQPWAGLRPTGKKKANAERDFSAIYRALTTSNAVLPVLLKAMGSKNIWGVAGLVNSEANLLKNIYNQVLYSSSLSSNILVACSRKKSRLMQVLRFRGWFFSGLSLKRRFRFTLFSKSFNVFRILSNLYTLPVLAVAYYNGFASSFSFTFTNTKLFLKNASLICIFEGLTSFRFYSLKRFFSLEKNRGNLFYNHNLVLRFGGLSLYNTLTDKLSQFCALHYAARFSTLKTIVNSAGQIDFIRQHFNLYCVDVLGTILDRKHWIAKFFDNNCFSYYMDYVDNASFLRANRYRGSIRKKAAVKARRVYFYANFFLSCYGRYTRIVGVVLANPFKAVKRNKLDSFCRRFWMLKMFRRNSGVIFRRLFRRVTRVSFFSRNWTWKILCGSRLITAAYFNNFLAARALKLNRVLQNSGTNRRAYSSVPLASLPSSVGTSWFLGRNLFYKLTRRHGGLIPTTHSSPMGGCYFSTSTIADCLAKEQLLTYCFHKMKFSDARRTADTKTLSIFGLNFLKQKGRYFSIMNNFRTSNFFFENSYRLYKTNFKAYGHSFRLPFISILKGAVNLIRPYYYFNTLTWLRLMSNLLVKSRFRATVYLPKSRALLGLKYKVPAFLLKRFERIRKKANRLRIAKAKFSVKGPSLWTGRKTSNLRRFWNKKFSTKFKLIAGLRVRRNAVFRTAFSDLKILSRIYRGIRSRAGTSGLAGSERFFVAYFEAMRKRILMAQLPADTRRNLARPYPMLPNGATFADIRAFNERFTQLKAYIKFRTLRGWRESEAVTFEDLSKVLYSAYTPTKNMRYFSSLARILKRKYRELDRELSSYSRFRSFVVPSSELTMLDPVVLKNPGRLWAMKRGKSRKRAGAGVARRFGKRRKVKSEAKVYRSQAKFMDALGKQNISKELRIEIRRLKGTKVFQIGPTRGRLRNLITRATKLPANLLHRVPTHIQFSLLKLSRWLFGHTLEKSEAYARVWRFLGGLRVFSNKRSLNGKLMRFEFRGKVGFFKARAHSPAFRKKSFAVGAENAKILGIDVNDVIGYVASCYKTAKFVPVRKRVKADKVFYNAWSHVFAKIIGISLSGEKLNLLSRKTIDNKIALRFNWLNDIIVEDVWKDSPDLVIPRKDSFLSTTPTTYKKYPLVQTWLLDDQLTMWRLLKKYNWIPRAQHLANITGKVIYKRNKRFVPMTRGVKFTPGRRRPVRRRNKRFYIMRRISKRVGRFRAESLQNRRYRASSSKRSDNTTYKNLTAAASQIVWGPIWDHFHHEVYVRQFMHTRNRTKRLAKMASKRDRKRKNKRSANSQIFKVNIFKNLFRLLKEASQGKGVIIKRYLVTTFYVKLKNVLRRLRVARGLASTRGGWWKRRKGLQRVRNPWAMKKYLKIWETQQLGKKFRHFLSTVNPCLNFRKRRAKRLFRKARLIPVKGWRGVAKFNRISRGAVFVYTTRPYMRKHWSKVKRGAYMKSTKIRGYYAWAVRSGHRFIKRTKIANLIRAGVKFGLRRSPNLNFHMWLARSFTWPAKLTGGGAWFRFRKLRIKRTVNSLKKIVLQNSIIYRNINHSSIGYDFFQKYFSKNRAEFLTINTVNRNLSSYLQTLFGPSNVYRRHRFLLTTASVVIDAVTRINFFSIFNFFKLRTYTGISSNSFKPKVAEVDTYKAKEIGKQMYSNRAIYFNFINNNSAHVRRAATPLSLVSTKTRAVICDNSRFVDNFWSEFCHWQVENLKLTY